VIARSPSRIEVASGRSLRVLEEGTGVPVLMLHGFTGSAESMNVAADALAGRAALIRPDLVGHGGSIAPDEPDAHSMEACVADLDALLDARGLPSAHVVGYSMGARVALALAVWRSARVRSLVLIGGRAGIEDSRERVERRRADEVLADRIEARGLGWFVDHWMGLPLFASQARLGRRALERARAARLRQRPAGLAASLRGMGVGAQPPLFDSLHRVDVPTLLVVGDEDAKFAALAEDLAGRLPHARVARIPCAGHAAHLENPAAFGAELRHFLAGLEPTLAEPEPGPDRGNLAQELMV